MVHLVDVRGAAFGRDSRRTHKAVDKQPVPHESMNRRRCLHAEDRLMSAMEGLNDCAGVVRELAE
ncbi:MAG: hypothetical protein A3G29_18970 [Burkholderiales bacterium RIFCSPLOWO2_12_FULL_64_99]|nr:MAG: hypothetical protein A3E52_08315 [Burkholderiales bacterium RIFCSPHIGHO2_12_FULL_63_20]OGB60884.1 MAG: hypothetical protein A3G29_18970 [Burkholderiales bacterium RIFCSPLOWO2_12_FULL_64_99]